MTAEPAFRHRPAEGAGGDARLAVVAAHPVQYYAPLFRALAHRCDLTVFYGRTIGSGDHARSGFGQSFDWDVDLLAGYRSEVLRNVAPRPSGAFFGCIAPGIGPTLRQGRFEAVLLIGWYQAALLQALAAAKRLGIPALVRGDSQLLTPRGPVKRAVHRLAYPSFLRRYDAALYVGTRSRAFYRHHGYPEERLFQSPHCVDTARFADPAAREEAQALRAAHGIPSTAEIVLFAGKLVPFKRPGIAVEAVARLRAEGSDARLMVAGSGALAGPVTEWARALGVPLTMLGFVNQSRMPAVHAAADVLVLPSARETWGLVANEALAAGTPVVVSREAGSAPDLCDGRAGIACDGGDPASVADALAALLSAPPDAAAIAARSAAHSVERAADGILAAVEAVRRPSRRSV